MQRGPGLATILAGPGGRASGGHPGRQQATWLDTEVPDVDQDGLFRALAIGGLDLHGDECQRLLGDLGDPPAATVAAARLGALIGLGSHGPSIEVAVEAAIAAGITADEVVSIYLALADVVGSARTIDAAHAIGLGLGIDVDGLLEDEGDRSG